jgi:hypothetical protein
VRITETLTWSREVQGTERIYTLRNSRSSPVGGIVVGRDGIRHWFGADYEAEGSAPEDSRERVQETAVSAALCFGLEVEFRGWGDWKS